MTDRHTVDTINDDQLDQLYDDLDRAEAATERVRETAEYFLHEYEGGPDPCAAAVLAALDDPKDQP